MKFMTKNWFRNAYINNSIWDLTKDGIIAANSKGVIGSVNKAVEEIFSYSSNEVVKQNIKMLIPDLYKSGNEESLTNIEGSFCSEGRRKDDSFFDIELSVSEIDNGILFRKTFIIIVKDVSERKEVENNLRFREKYLDTLYETMIDGIIVFDEYGFIQTINTAADNIFGYDVHEIKGKHIRDLIVDDGLESHGTFIRSFSSLNENEGFRGAHEVIGLRKDGSTFPLELAVGEMMVNGKHLFNGVIRDITDRKIVEEQLQEQRNALQITSAFERIQTQVMSIFSKSIDVESVFIKALEVLDEACHFAASGVYLFDEGSGDLRCVANLGLPDLFKEPHSPGNGLVGRVARTKKAVLLSGDTAAFHVDTGLFSIVPKAVVLSPILYNDKLLGVITLASIDDVDQEKFNFITRLSSQIGVSLNTLYQYHNLKVLAEELKERGKEISQKNLLLEKANRLKTEFLANMSHELRTPLNAIIGFSDILLDSQDDLDSDERADFVEEILTSANHLLSLINDILDLSKIESGKMDLFLEPLNISDLIQNAHSIFKEQAHARNINLAFNVDEGDTSICVDVRKIKQVIYNLLSNAIKFTPEGGNVSLVVSRGPDGELQAAITDTGIGIEAGKMDLLFSPFEQLDGSVSRQYGGTGLGLAMVKRLVELHGGTVGVDSVEGEGSRFYFSIPYRSSDELAERPSKLLVKETMKTDDHALPMNSKATDDVNVSYARLNILLVEDNEREAGILKTLLEKAGYCVVLASNGFEALESLKIGKPELIVLDMLMPEMDGFNFIKAKNEMDEYADIPVVITSVLAEQLEPSEYLANVVLSKPVNREALLSQIEKLIAPKKELKAFFKPTVMVVDNDPRAIRILNAYLSESDYRVLYVNTGGECISLAKKELPDLIVLDLMMPDIDGFTLVANLKQADATKNIPLFILTANEIDHESQSRLLDDVDAIASKNDISGVFLVDEFKRILSRRNPL